MMKLFLERLKPGRGCVDTQVIPRYRGSSSQIEKGENHNEGSHSDRVGYNFFGSVVGIYNFR